MSQHLLLDTAELSIGNQSDLQQRDQHVLGQLTLSLGATVEAIVPICCIVVCSYGLKVNAPGCRGQVVLVIQVLSKSSANSCRDLVAALRFSFLKADGRVVSFFTD